MLLAVLPFPPCVIHDLIMLIKAISVLLELYTSGAFLLWTQSHHTISAPSQQLVADGYCELALEPDPLVVVA